MTLPTTEPIKPDEGSNLPPARRRRQRRSLIPAAGRARVEFLDDLSERVTPSLDFFLFSLLAGLVLGAGLLLDAPALIVLAALLAPFMAPVIGTSLASVVGSVRYFFMSLGSMSIGSLLIFLCGTLAGWLTKLLPGQSHLYSQPIYHAHFTLADFIVLTIGAALTVYLIVRAPQNRPLVASAALAYELFIPLGVAGFGLTSGVPNLFPDGLIVFAVHLAWAALIGAAMLAILGLRPGNFFGYTLSTTLVLVGLAAVIVLTGVGTAFGAHLALPPTASQTPSLTPTLTLTPRPPTGTLTATNTLIPTTTPTRTITPEPTPVWAKIRSILGDGAVVHSEPGYQTKVIKSLVNTSMVQVMPDTTVKDGVIWRKIRMADGLEGWIWEALLQTATPKPGW